MSHMSASVQCLVIHAGHAEVNWFILSVHQHNSACGELVELAHLAPLNEMEEFRKAPSGNPSNLINLGGLDEMYLDCSLPQHQLLFLTSLKSIGCWLNMTTFFYVSLT